MNNRLNIYFKRFLDIIFYLGIIIEITVPFTLRRAVDFTVETFGSASEYAPIKDHFLFAVVSIMLAGLFALLIIYELRKMMKTVIEDNCFIQDNVTSLYRMGNYAFAITVVKFMRVFVYFTLAGVVTAGVFCFAGILSKVLAKVFDRAVRYKEENDLTI
ncbi:DUF2975 domain-containing protein [Butyrivibrio sp. VCD2006]|uniref:DUF2975 domain-containing protein n=1 Tax=Butyrivibrio sp. VCD2006 TaxID=1280664 RepID=UPI00040F94F9|nr:DUF2975 domain-containing protein [Butyrivibrio sp. VCD2006]